MKKYFSFLFLNFICLGMRAQTLEIDSIKNVLTLHVNDTLKMAAYNELTYLYLRIDLDSAIGFSLTSLKTYANNANQPRVSDIYGALGAAYGYKRDFDNSIKYFLKSLKILKKTKLKGATARSNFNIGLLYYHKANYKLAAEYYLNAQHLLEEIKDVKTLPKIYEGLGTIYEDMSNNAEAMRYYEMAMKMYLSNKDTLGISSAYNSIGNVYSNLNRLEEALVNYKTAIELKEKVNELRGLSANLNNIGNTLLKLKRFDEALTYFNKSLTYKGANKDPISTAFSLDGIGAIYYEKGNYNMAIYNFEASIKISRAVDSKTDILSTYEKMALCYSKQGNFKKAFEYEALLFKTKDSVLNAENTKQITEMTTKYESEKKQLEIENLNKDNAIQFQEISENELLLKQRYMQIVIFAIGFILVSIVAFFIFRSYQQKKKSNIFITEQKREVEHHRDLVEIKNKEITDSIYYAKRIQTALIAGESILKNNLPEHFVFYKPKDIVSGDFYWANATNDNKFYLCTGDCTGHGVPGAFMSLLNISFLNEAVIEKKIDSPDKILEHVRSQIISSLNPVGVETESWDGMDGTLCMFDFKGGWLRFAAGNNPLWLIRNKELKEFAADKMPIGKHHGATKPFTLNTLGLRRGDIIYTFTDGFADQFGGEKGKKFKYKNLQKVLLENMDKSMAEQKQILIETLENWQGKMEQVDDILIIGIRV